MIVFFILLENNVFIAFCHINIEDVNTNGLNSELSLKEQEKIIEKQKE